MSDTPESLVVSAYAALTGLGAAKRSDDARWVTIILLRELAQLMRESEAYACDYADRLIRWSEELDDKATVRPWNANG